jgi:hypothetical protein
MAGSGGTGKTADLVPAGSPCEKDADRETSGDSGKKGGGIRDEKEPESKSSHEKYLGCSGVKSGLCSRRCGWCLL